MPEISVPEISVIVANWNGKRFLETCLNALRRQTFQNFEALLVDNGSTDGSVEYVRTDFPEVTLIALNENRGFTGGNIAGYQQARGKLIVLLNNDTEADPHWLEELYRASQEFRHAGSFASKMLHFDERNCIDNCGFAITAAALTIDLGRGEQDGPVWVKSRKVFGACGGAAAYRRSMLDDIGFLDEDFFMVYEDVDLGFRAQLRGYECVFVPGAIVYHHLGATRRRTPGRNVFFSQRNVELVYLKNMPVGQILRSIPQRLVYEFGAAAYFVKTGTGAAFFKAKMDVFRQLSVVLAKRKAIQSKRTVTNDQLRVVMQKSWFGSKCRKLVSAWRGTSKVTLRISQPSS
jgi:GT2 family glycosyltransferase